MIQQVGGVTKVPITTEMLQYVRLANQRYTREREEVKEAAKKKAKDAEEAAEAAHKRIFLTKVLPVTHGALRSSI